MRAFPARRTARNFYLMNERARKVRQIKGGVERNTGMVTLDRRCHLSLFFFSFSFFLFGARRRDANMFDANARSPPENGGNGSGSVYAAVDRALRYISCPTRAVPVSPHVHSFRFTCGSP